MGITAASVSAAAKGEETMAQEKARGLLDRIAMFIATEPLNSNASRFAQGLALQFSASLAYRLGEEWDARAAAIADCCLPAASGAATTGAGISAAVAGSLANVPPPAPGYHDATAFPELNAQRVPADLCEEEEVELKCVIHNARPRPDIIWYLGDREFVSGMLTI